MVSDEPKITKMSKGTGHSQKNSDIGAALRPSPDACFEPHRAVYDIECCDNTDLFELRCYSFGNLLLLGGVFHDITELKTRSVSLEYTVSSWCPTRLGEF